MTRVLPPCWLNSLAGIGNEQSTATDADRDSLVYYERSSGRDKNGWAAQVSSIDRARAETLSTQMCVSSTVQPLCTVLYSRVVEDCTSHAQCLDFPDPASQAHHGTRHSQDNKIVGTSIRLVREHLTAGRWLSELPA